jgi:hypothetical protein
MHCAGQPDNADETKRQSTADLPRDQSRSATVAGEFLQLDFVSREQEQHSESQLPKCFKAFADGRQTKAARADQHTESKE